MSSKVDQASTNVPTSTAPLSVPSSGTKISMFGNKAGFIIPKNKLSGSLVPIHRGNKTMGSCDAPTEESIKQSQRKTKWGPDLTQDISVRKGRAIAYQTRVDQIAQLLKLGTLESGNNQDSPLASQILNYNSADGRIKTEKVELELEKHETIGEILKLNPSYKVPADYKPLLKEAKVPIPIKEYPSYNFIGLIYGPAKDTQKRLEKETGAKIQVYGINGESREKAEITPAEGNTIHDVYDELYVHISADTYEKVDAAVALIELLVTPVSVNRTAGSTTSAMVSGDDGSTVNLSQGTAPPYTVSISGVNQGVVQPLVGSAPFPAQGEYLAHPGPWLPTGLLHNQSLSPPGFTTHSNPSPPLLSIAVQSTPSSMNPSNMPSLFGPRPVLDARFGSASQNPQSQPQVLQHPYILQSPPLGYTVPHRNPRMPAFDFTPAQPFTSVPPPFCSKLSTPTGPPQIAMSVVPSQSQSVAVATFPYRPQTLVGNSTEWLQVPVVSTASLGPSNNTQRAPLMVPRGHQSVASQPVIVLETQPLSSSMSTISPPTAAPSFTSVSQPQIGFAPPIPTPGPSPVPIPMQYLRNSPLQHATVQGVIPNLSPNQVLRPTPPTMSNQLPPPLQSEIPCSASRGLPSFTPVRSFSLTASRPHQPVPGDFTFQSQRPQNLTFHVGPSGPSAQNTPTLNQVLQPHQPTPTPSFLPEVHNSGPSQVLQCFSRPPIANQMNQSVSQLPGALTGNSTTSPAPPRYPTFPNRSPSALSGPFQFGARNSHPASQTMNLSGVFPPRPGNPVQFRQNCLTTSSQPQNFFVPTQQLVSSVTFEPGKQISSPSRLQQIYDPFSPTSVSLNPRPASHPANTRKPENDPEYEDLMASVGVK